MLCEAVWVGYHCLTAETDIVIFDQDRMWRFLSSWGVYESKQSVRAHVSAFRIDCNMNHANSQLRIKKFLVARTPALYAQNAKLTLIVSLFQMI